MIKEYNNYPNRNNLKDIVTVVSIKYVEGIKTVHFIRPNTAVVFKLPIEVFESNFINGN